MGLDRCILTYPSLYHTEYFPCPRNPVCFIHLSTVPSRATMHLFLFPEFCFFQNVTVGNICQLETLSDWLLSLGNMCLRFFHVSSWLDSSSLFSTEQYSTVWKYNTHSPTEVYLDCFQVVAIMNNAAINIHVQACG